MTNQSVTLILGSVFLALLLIVVYQGWKDGKQLTEAEFKEKEKELDVARFERINRGNHD